eukprot:jgi/Mesvir1/9075/Mv21352-RA.1
MNQRQKKAVWASLGTAQGVLVIAFVAWLASMWRKPNMLPLFGTNWLTRILVLQVIAALSWLTWGVLKKYQAKRGLDKGAVVRDGQDQGQDRDEHDYGYKGRIPVLILRLFRGPEPGSPAAVASSGVPVQSSVHVSWAAPTLLLSDPNRFPSAANTPKLTADIPTFFARDPANELFFAAALRRLQLASPSP